MKVSITVPQNIVNYCKECGWDSTETEKYFLQYISEVMNDPYGHFFLDFDCWLQDLSEEDIELK